VYSVQNYI